MRLNAIAASTSQALFAANEPDVLPGLGLPRQSHHRYHSRPADQHPGSAGPLRPPPLDAPSAALAVGAGLVPAVPGHPGTTPTGLTRPPADRPYRNRSGKAGQNGPAGTPTPGVKIRTPSQTRSNVARCIQVEHRDLAGEQRPAPLDQGPLLPRQPHVASAPAPPPPPSRSFRSPTLKLHCSIDHGQTEPWISMRRCRSSERRSCCRGKATEG